MSQNYTYPPGFATATNPSVGLNGAAIPLSSTEIGGKNASGNLTPVSVDASGNVNVNVVSSSLPSGAATSANQVLEITQLTNIDNKLPPALGAQLVANSLSVNIASDQVVPISASALPLPSGAATSANQTSEITQLTNISGQLPASLGQKPAANSLSVVLASGTNSNPVTISGKSVVNHIRNDYSSVNVTTAAYVQILASTASGVSEIFIFDSSGQTLVLAFGAAASEVDQIYIVPGGNGIVPLFIPASTRLSVKAVSATANVGELDINLLG